MQECTLSPSNAAANLCDCLHDAIAGALAPVDMPFQIISIYPSKPVNSWFVVHYTMLLPHNLLDTTMTALRVLIIFLITIHELMT